MMESMLVSGISLALGIGILHALEPDHLAAVTAMSAEGSGWRRSLGYSTRWALGHGAAVAAISGLVLFGITRLDPRVSSLGELLAGTLLVLLGLKLLVMQPHHRHAGPSGANPRFAMLFGSIHGVAGVAPLLLVLGTRTSDPLATMLAVLGFCAGVVVAMAGVGLALSLGWRRWNPFLMRQAAPVQRLVGACSMLAGGRLLWSFL